MVNQNWKFEIANELTHSAEQYLRQNSFGKWVNVQNRTLPNKDMQKTFKNTRWLVKTQHVQSNWSDTSVTNTISDTSVTDNFMKTNPGKFQFTILGVKNIAPFRLNVNCKIIPCSNEVKLLGTTINNELKFKKHIEDLCKNACYKLHALRSIRGYLIVEKARILSNAFIDSQFNYASLIWMFAGKTLINKICKIHHRTIQVVYNEYNKSYEELLQRHLHYLALEVYKSLMHLSPEFMWSYFNENSKWGKVLNQICILAFQLLTTKQDKKLPISLLLAGFCFQYIAWKVSKYGVFGPYFPVFGLDTEIYCVNLLFTPNTVKYGPEKTPHLNPFHAVVNFPWHGTFACVSALTVFYKIGITKHKWNGKIAMLRKGFGGGKPSSNFSLKTKW